MRCPINTLISQGIIPIELFLKKWVGRFFCVLLPMHQNFSQLLAGKIDSIYSMIEGLFPLRNNCVDKSNVTGLNHFPFCEKAWPD